jgi:hypothetical protein
VVFADTIDGIQYGPGPDSNPVLGGVVGGKYVTTSMTLSPVTGWGGFGFNYWESSGSWYAPGVFLIGTPLLWAYNYPPYGPPVTHGSIGRNPGVLNSVLSDVDYVYGMLSF